MIKQITEKITLKIALKIKIYQRKNQFKILLIYQKQKNQKLKYLKKVNIKILGFKKWNNLMKNVDILEYIYYINIDHIINNQIPKEYLNNIYIGKGLPWDLLHMNDQIEINEKMRSILIDWIIDIHYNFGRWNFIYGCFNNR